MGVCKLYLHSLQQVAGDLKPVTGAGPDIINGLKI
jgi:hypothetical protein